jgi:hypothetical protein
MGVDHLSVDIEAAVGGVQVEEAPANVALRQAIINLQLAFLANSYTT